VARYLTGKGIHFILSFFRDSKPAGSLEFTAFPAGTFVSNLAACVILGAVVVTIGRGQLSQYWAPFLIIGFCGGYSTFSTFSYETLGLISAGKWPMALLNIGVSVATCIFALFVLSKQLK
jgi:CrcB protein